MSRRLTVAATIAAAWLVGTSAVHSDTIPVMNTKALNIPVNVSASTVTPDGDVWILDGKNNAVGRVTPDGTLTEFPIPTPQCSPWVITPSADGNLWFSEVAGKIAQITPAGVITEFTVPASMGAPWKIAVTADGRIWFLEVGMPDRVGRVDAAGNFADFQIPGAKGLDALSPAVDGALWVFDDDPSTNNLIKVRPDGTVASTQSMPSTTYTGASAGITALDGHFWFTHNTGLDRVNDDGSITEYHIPWANSVPGGIALGGDGNIWFTDYNTGQIGQLVVSTATTGGQATINGSMPVGTKLAEGFFLPPTFAAFASSVSDAVRDEATPAAPDGDPCGSIYFLERSDVPSVANLLATSMPASGPCADLSITFGGVSQIYRGGGGALVFNVTNNGPNDAIPTIPLSGSQKTNDLVSATIIINDTESVFLLPSVGSRACMGPASLAPGQTGRVIVSIGRNRVDAVADNSVSVTATVSSPLPDPAPGNNSSSGSVDFSALPVAPAPPADTSPSPPPPQRGHP